jgi:hypothetical protein
MTAAAERGGAVLQASEASSCPVSRPAAARILRAWNIEDLRRIAQKRLPRGIFDFFDGAAEDEITLGANRAAFERVRLAPKALTGVAQIDTSTTILGARSKLPRPASHTRSRPWRPPRSSASRARRAGGCGSRPTSSASAI